MKAKQKIRNTKKWRKNHAKRATRPNETPRPAPRHSTTGAQWNYEPAEAWRGTVIVGKSERPTWWCAGMEGQRRKCVKVQSWGEPFFIDDEDGRGSLKVFERGGGPDSHHASIPVDDADSFIPENS